MKQEAWSRKMIRIGWFHIMGIHNLSHEQFSYKRRFSITKIQVVLMEKSQLFKQYLKLRDHWNEVFTSLYTQQLQTPHVRKLINSAAVATAAPVKASVTILSLLPLVTADARAPVMAFFWSCLAHREKEKYEHGLIR